jgi:hypothetical protein
LHSLALTYDAVLDRLDDSFKESERSDELPSPLEVPPPLPSGSERSLLAKALVEPAEPEPEEAAPDDLASDDASEPEPSLLSAPDDPALLLSSLE